MTDDEASRPFYFGHYRVYRDGRLRNSQGHFLTPVMPPGYIEAAYNLRHKKKGQRIKARTILRIVWGIKRDPGDFSLAWIKQIRKTCGFRAHVHARVPVTHPDWPRHMSEPDNWWNMIDHTPGCEGPASPAYCPLEQSMAVPCFEGTYIHAATGDPAYRLERLRRLKLQTEAEIMRLEEATG